jgi:tellurite resistance-related uncharacterized protein
MKTWNEIKNKVKDISGVENPENWTYYQENGVYYPVSENKETYYLIFNDDVADIWGRSNTPEEFIQNCERDMESYSTFKFIEGKTKSIDFAEKIEGLSYSVITQEDYEKIN